MKSCTLALSLLALVALVGCNSQKDADPVLSNAQGQISESSAAPEGSVGQPGDPELDRISPSATRTYYVGEDEVSSTRTNLLGFEQTLFYDSYPSSRPDKKFDVTVMYIHGGGYNVGYANNAGIIKACHHFNELGYDCVSIEYRRGWFGQGNQAVMGQSLDFSHSSMFEEATELAKEDVLDGWKHFDEITRPALNMGKMYVIAGESAGSSIASRITLTNSELDKKVVGAILGFGTHDVDEQVVSDARFPVVIQGGMFDPIQPLYNNNIFFDAAMPVAKGLYNLYEELSGRGHPTRLLISAQKAHGFGDYQNAEGLPTHYEKSMQFFRNVYVGKQVKLRGIEYRFSRPDRSLIGILDMANPVIHAVHDGEGQFIYSPYQELLRDGMSPDELTTRFRTF